MKGIIIQDFELIIKKNKYNIEETNEKMTDICENFVELKKNISSPDLNFLINKLESEINYFKNIKLKIDSYQTTIKNVLASYKNEEEELAINVNQITP